MHRLGIAERDRSLLTARAARYALLCVVLAASCTAGNVHAPYASSAGFESERLWGTTADYRWEPVVAADPDSSWVYQLTTGQRPNYLLFRASSDSGTTWGVERHLCRRGVRVPFQYDPQMAVANGTIDVVCLDGFRPGVVFARSRDHGVTWTKAVRLDGRQHYSDKPTLAVSSDGKDVYVSYNDRYALYVASSHDGGSTWSSAVRATKRRGWYYSYGATVGSDGTVWFAVDGELGRNETGAGQIALVASSDGGVTWREVPFAATHEGQRCGVRHCYPDFFTGQDAVASDRHGNLVFVFARNDSKHAPNSLYVSRSSDDGKRWSAPALLNAAGNNTSPAIAAGPSAGDFRLVWQDDRNGPKTWNTWYARSTDGGTTWSGAIRLSNREDGAPYKHHGGYEFPFGDYLGLSVDGNGVNHVIWGEGSAVYVPGGTWWTRGP
ncbi:MAG TPA: sialidase family protein [Candidatus Binatia bacterium]|nr:sialidase family protein [Candidatus Binatia bacterium]